jgi:hypothetical protein
VVPAPLDELVDQLGPELGTAAGRVDLDVYAAGALDLAPGVAAELLDGESLPLRLLDALRISLWSGGMLAVYNGPL